MIPSHQAAAIPAPALAANPHCILAVTPYGGHLGWIRADHPLGPPWTDEPMLEFLQVPSPRPCPASCTRAWACSDACIAVAPCARVRSDPDRWVVKQLVPREI